MQIAELYDDCDTDMTVKWSGEWVSVIRDETVVRRDTQTTLPASYLDKK